MVGRFCNVPQKKIFRWYQDVLSGYSEKMEGELGENDFIEEGKIVKVPILKEENMGTDMHIDEKVIDRKIYTVLGNNETGKIAALIQSLKAKTIVKSLANFGDKCFCVKRLTRDLSQTYDWVGREAFMNAEHIGDKFHVLMHGFESLQGLRIYYRQKELQRIKLLQEQFLKDELRKKKQLKEKYNTSYRIKKFRQNLEVLDNGETMLQLLARSRHLLFKYQSEWSEEQQTRANTLFCVHPDIERAHELICDFRNWYKPSNIGKSLKNILLKLNSWYKKVKVAAIEHVDIFRALVRRHEGVILNYFKSGRTNAKAEALNNKIQRFVSTNHGTRNIDFFLFRLAIYFS